LFETRKKTSQFLTDYIYLTFYCACNLHRRVVIANYDGIVKQYH
jgi:hypothetical protein